MRKTLLVAAVACFLFAASAAADDKKPEDVAFADSGYDVIIITGKTAKKLHEDCGCGILLNQKEKQIIILDVPKDLDI